MNKSIEELIQRLKEPDYQYYGCELSKDEADLAISALEKQISKKPIEQELREHDYVRIGKCSVCCEWWITEFHKYCPKCGQAIDWRDEDE